ncbi:AAL092Cp [Eremothecium gossypii ATCC 10895]|uniref:AAL092Cp n=1 Tax=Eremothecium gossypii (strain ATCC 10895 / CBS 109.51 / FGSC 9923 / NRRL Y-1056) TaxID=284811 RepID=Q75F20_EREGS|nr:AAL092Cp [Eremothecium gossypii ATCC 10895]AAS50274.1 AAL092Cp [Eremothecium gossypii ATCC 10895]AEY94559.1 FAAL092Cp [Eremothecium gossypii FDAG1]
MKFTSSILLACVSTFGTVHALYSNKTTTLAPMGGNQEYLVPNSVSTVVNDDDTTSTITLFRTITLDLPLTSASSSASSSATPYSSYSGSASSSASAPASSPASPSASPSSTTANCTSSTEQTFSTSSTQLYTTWTLTGSAGPLVTSSAYDKYVVYASAACTEKTVTVTEYAATKYVTVAASAMPSLAPLSGYYSNSTATH